MASRFRNEDFEEFDEEGDEVEDFDDVEATAECPYCGEEIYEDANWCPYCTNYISHEDAPKQRKPGWLVAGVIVCLAIVTFWLIFFY
jgi:predicted nucleic acid-binding Zn ribbon protein